MLWVVADKPHLTCAAEWSGSLGQTDYEILCTGHMNPGPLQVVWKWDSATGGKVEILNEVINNADLAKVIFVFSDFKINCKICQSLLVHAQWSNRGMKYYIKHRNNSVS